MQLTRIATKHLRHCSSAQTANLHRPITPERFRDFNATRVSRSKRSNHAVFRPMMRSGCLQR
ncbi:hypothetical protein ROLI_039120 [Roseobacter fucihabitans]|uniref:Uncharacterized protein n=1 Tax=Roseobacter fucihabitans TaxID=1537242 RepID=A0ABZ2BXL2_9RHOB|nr:hypothetical protein [Roseobacter litoralis]